MDIEKYKDILNEQKKKLEEELKDIAVKNPKVKGDWIPVSHPPDEVSPDDEAQIVENYQSNVVLTEVLEARYQNILRALKKIEKGTYGICEVTNKPISEERLNANPSARTCRDHLDANLGVN